MKQVVEPVVRGGVPVVTVVILNYCTPRLVVECLTSLAADISECGAQVVVVDNGSGDDSAGEIARFLETQREQHGWAGAVNLVCSPINGGFAAGNNIGLRAFPAEFFWLLNSDTRVRPGTLQTLLAAASQEADAAIIAPRLEDEDGTAQISCFRYISPVSEFLSAADTSVLDAALSSFVVPIGVSQVRCDCDWASFASVLLRRSAVDQVGYMDEGFFMYFEDSDYCRQLRRAGWRVVYEPTGRVVHLRGGSSSVKTDLAMKRRPPAYFYASRTRYFRKWYGPAGLLLANMAWWAGRAVAYLRRLGGKPLPLVCKGQARDQWLNWRNPLANRR